MANPSGSFIWYELMTTDADAASAFYGEVVGWTIGANAMPGGGMDYRMIVRADGGMNGGVLSLTDEMTAGGARPGWLGYIYVPDVDAAVESVVADGGAVHMPAMTMEGVGRMAMVADPQGAPFYLMTPQPPADAPDAASDVFSGMEAQHVRWNELSTTDPDAAIAFYTSHFGWTQNGEMDMGTMGKYRFVQLGDIGLGAIMPKMPQMPVSAWTYYIGVDDIDRALAAVQAGGGQVLHGPDQIPGGEYSLNALDPQGAAFGIVGPRKG